MTAPVRVVVVEDSRLQRLTLCSFLRRFQGLQVVGEADNGQQALELVKHLRPDIILMDVRMPTLDGLEATQRIMAEQPTPILLMTAPDNLSNDVDLGLQALDRGALDLIPKPDLSDPTQGEALVSRLQLLAGVPVISHVRGGGRRRSAGNRPTTGFLRRAKRLVALVASTGGPNALKVVLTGLPADLRAAVLIVQHLDRAFVDGLARWLDDVCPLAVTVPQDGEELREGCVYVCPTGLYAEVNERRRLSLTQEPVPPGGHCPSGDRLLRTVAEVYGADAVGVILTGMGGDGAQGLLQVRASGGTTIAQDEATSVIYGMPKEAAVNGAAAAVLPLEEIGPAIASAVNAP